MRRMNGAKKTLTAALTAALAAAMMASCGMMTEDRTSCPTCFNPLRVSLRYDYTIRDVNTPNLVEAATVYVADAQTGRVVAVQEARNTATSQPLHNPTYAFNFEDLPAGSYKVAAVAHSPAASTPRSLAPQTLSEGAQLASLHFTTPTTGATPTGDTLTVSDADTLDIVWNTLQTKTVALMADEPAEVELRMLRLTNNLNVLVSRRDAPTDNSHTRYDVQVVATAETTTQDNQQTPDGARLLYRPYAQWTTEGVVDEPDADAASRTRADVAERTAHYDLSLARLYSHDNAPDNARLQIFNHETGTKIADIDICYYLARFRNYYETQHYGVQEYLDRECDYRLSFELEGNTWKYMTISISTLAWSIRIQNETL